LRRPRKTRGPGASDKACGETMSEPSSFWQRRRVQSFHEMRGELRLFFEQRGIRAAVSDDLILATQEACNNACQHGTDRAGCDVVVACLQDTVVIEVADRGHGFDLEAVRATWPPELWRGDGRGLFLIAELTDQIEVVRRRRGTLVRIIKLVR